MRKIVYEQFNNLCLIRNFGSEHFAMYSYHTGYYYLIPKQYLNWIPEWKPDQNEVYEIENELFDFLVKNAVNPEIIDLKYIHSPIVIGVMVSNLCNLNCVYCIARNANSYSKYNYLLKNTKELYMKLSSSAVMGLMISGGEPALNSNLTDFLRTMPPKRFFCELDTNGTCLDENIISALCDLWVVPRISIDSINPSVHNKVRGQFDKTFLKVTELYERNIEFRISTVLHSYNKDDIFNLAEWLISLGIPKWHIYKLQRAYAPSDLWLSDEDNKKIIQSLKQKVGTQIDIIAKFLYKNDGFASFLIDSEGNCFSSLKNQKINFGNIFEEEIHQIWDRLPDEYKKRHLHKYCYYCGKDDKM